MQQWCSGDFFSRGGGLCMMSSKRNPVFTHIQSCSVFSEFSVVTCQIWKLELISIVKINMFNNTYIPPRIKTIGLPTGLDKHSCHSTHWWSKSKVTRAPDIATLPPLYREAGPAVTTHWADGAAIVKTNVYIFFIDSFFCNMLKTVCGRRPPVCPAHYSPGTDWSFSIIRYIFNELQ